MAITNGYATLAEVKAALGITDTGDDSSIELVVETASRLIDEHCGRSFYARAAETRYYTAELSEVLDVGDVTAVTTLSTDEDGDGTFERTWASTDYLLAPFNAATDGRPYREIAISPNGRYSFPQVVRGVKVVGDFGWSAVPKQVKQACLLQSTRLFKRSKEAPFGVAAVLDGGGIRLLARLDADVELLLWPFVVAGLRDI